MDNHAIMKKKEIVKMVADVTGATQHDSAVIIDAYVACIRGALIAGRSVPLHGIGTFCYGKVPAREERIMHFKDREIIIPASDEHERIKFKITPKLKTDFSEARKN